MTRAQLVILALALLLLGAHLFAVVLAARALYPKHRTQEQKP